MSGDGKKNGELSAAGFTRIENYVLDALTDRGVSLAGRAVCIELVRRVLARSGALTLDSELKPIQFKHAYSCPFINPKTFHRALRELEEKGFIRRVRYIGLIAWAFDKNAALPKFGKAKKRQTTLPKNGKDFAKKYQSALPKNGKHNRDSLQRPDTETTPETARGGARGGGGAALPSKNGERGGDPTPVRDYVEAELRKAMRK